MVQLPQFRVFIEQDKVKDELIPTFSEGIPCSDFLALDADQIVPKNFVFLVDDNRLCISKIALLEDVFKSIHTGTWDTEGTSIICIPLEQVTKVVDQYNRVHPIDLLKQSWIVNNHVFKIEETTLKLTGPQAHVLIMGLQQALFIQATDDPTLNNLFLGQACSLIKRLSLDNPNLKEFFLTGFPCEYMKSARDQLFSK